MLLWEGGRAMPAGLRYYEPSRCLELGYVHAGERDVDLVHSWALWLDLALPSCVMDVSDEYYCHGLRPGLTWNGRGTWGI